NHLDCLCLETLLRGLITFTLCHSLQRAKSISSLFNNLRTLCEKQPGCTPFIPTLELAARLRRAVCTGGPSPPPHPLLQSPRALQPNRTSCRALRRRHAP